MTNFVNLVRSLLLFPHDPDAALHKVADNILAQFHSDTLTLHALDASRGVLELKLARGIPAPVLEIIRSIPLGKGIAGECAATGKPVTSCNIQKDESGVVRPGAKQTGVGGALCVPARNAAGAVVGTLGIGTLDPYEYTAEETSDLLKVARVLGDLVLERAAAG